MAIDYEKLMNWRFPPVRQTLSKRDCILYALGVGLGNDPLDAAQLRFLLEDRLAALPTMAVVLAYPGFWVKDPGTGIDWLRVVHGEQAIMLHGPLPVEAELVGTSRVTGIVDKGAGKGAVLYSERRISDAATGELYATLAMSTFCRGDGGFGGPSGPSRPPHPIPERRSRGRVRSTDPAWPLHARHRRPRVAAELLRLRSGAHAEPGAALLGAGLSR